MSKHTAQTKKQTQQQQRRICRVGRVRRIRASGSVSVFHCVSRTVNGEIFLSDAEKDIMQKQLHQVADFCGVQVVTYALMGNHFHVLVRVQQQGEVADAELLRRYSVLYPKPTKWAPADVKMLAEMLKKDDEEAKAWRKQMLRRMGDVSEFMKTFKQRFSIWYNRTHERFGTLWSERFSSTLVQADKFFAMESAAAYIDLNPIRARIVADPKDYRWCGYAEAVATGGNGTMRRNLRYAVSSDNLSDEEMLETYRVVLFGKGATAKCGDPSAARIAPEVAQAVAASGGKLSRSERLCTKATQFTRGGAIGDAVFVGAILAQYTRETSRRPGCKPIPFADADVGAEISTDWPEGLCALRRRKH
ncbi:MAG: transposase [Puniceicoccales bacterium]|nr:transposase [Puniceicoccales bacterium]